MTFIATPGVVKAEMRYRLDLQQVENVLWFKSQTTVDLTTMAALGAALDTWWHTYCRPRQTTETELREIYLTDQASSVAPVLSVSPTVPTSGAVSEDTLPNNCALTVSFKTAGRGRSARGRNYFLGIPETVVDSSQVQNVYASFILGAYQGLLADIPASGWDWVVVSHQFNKVPRSTGLAQPVTSVALTDLVIDSQRRRLPGRGV